MGNQYLILHSIIGIIATACFGKLLFYSIQDGQIFGKWQRVLEYLDKSGYSIVKPLGYCEMCFSFWLAVLSWCVFFIVVPHSLGWYWLLHYCIYVSMSANMTLYFLTKLFRK